MLTPEQIRELRLALGLTTTQFAFKMGVGYQTVKAWETGRRHPPYKRMMALNELAKQVKLATAS